MILDGFRLDGRVALVTGANRGLGQGCALALAEAGADVALLGRTDPLETTERVLALGRRVLYLPCDLSTTGPEQLSAAIDRVGAELGRLDIVVNNAGIIRRAPAVEVSPTDWDDVITVNLDAVFQLCQAAGRVMIAQGGGKIINIASMLSYQGGIRVPAYTAAKHAVVGLTKAAALDYAPTKVRVNAVCPGSVRDDTQAEGRMLAEIARALDVPVHDHEKTFVQAQPMNALIEPEDVAAAIVFLASDESRQITGTVLTVDGGFSIR
jgi:2-deoxy-D-gluconate 3-dehydrogenase